jgi:hypothetical protein
MMRTVGMVAALSLLCGTAMAQTASPAACAALRQLQVQGVAPIVSNHGADRSTYLLESQGVMASFVR